MLHLAIHGVLKEATLFTNGLCCNAQLFKSRTLEDSACIGSFEIIGKNSNDCDSEIKHLEKLRLNS